MGVKRYRPLNVVVEALRIVEGETTKGDILAFCPDANVGATVTEDDPSGLASTDLYWIELPPDDDGTSWCAREGDYVVKGVTGHFFVRPERSFAEAYEELS